MALKIALTHVNEAGEKGVHPETMELLLAFGGHRQVCDECERACSSMSGLYCETGESLFLQLMERPDVTFEQEGK